MPRPRIGALPMTSAQRQARRRARLGRERPLSAPPARRPLPRPQRWAAVATLTALQDEISRLARQPASQPRRFETGGEAAGHHRARPRGAARDRPTARLRPRLIQEVYHPITRHHDQIAELDGHNSGRLRTAALSRRRDAPGRFQPGGGRRQCADFGEGGLNLIEGLCCLNAREGTIEPFNRGQPLERLSAALEPWGDYSRWVRRRCTDAARPFPSRPMHRPRDAITRKAARPPNNHRL
jgi:hypothetical protein